MNITKVICETPTPDKKPTRIDKWKYEIVRQAILQSIPQGSHGLLFKELPTHIENILSAEDQKNLGSIRWYTTCVKLDMEVKGDIMRVAGETPQRLIHKNKKS